MITSAPNGKAERTSGTNQILLTLKKNPDSCHVSAIIKRVGSNRDVKVLNGKMIEVNPKHWEAGLKMGHRFSLEEMHSLAEPESVDIMLPKITQICTNKTSILDTQRTSILKNTLLSERHFFQKCTSLLNECQRSHRFVRKPAKTKLRNFNYDNLGSTLNKHNRFVPNILRNTKIGEEPLNHNRTSIGFHPLLTTRMKGTKTSSKDHNVIKRNRKQVLMSERLERDYLQKDQSLHMEHELIQSLPNIPDQLKLGEESGFAASTIDASNEGHENVDQTLELHSETSEAREEESLTESFDSNDLNKPNAEVLYCTKNSPSKDETICTDKSVQKILDEFKEPDYKNYILSEDLCFDEIDQMDKLLISDNNDLLKETPIFNDSTQVVKYDINGNDIDNYGNAMEIKSDTNKWKTSNLQLELDQYYHKKESESIINTPEPKLDINLESMGSNASNIDENLILSHCQTELSTNEIKNYFDASDDYDKFQCNIAQLSSSLDTASESVNEEGDCTESVSISLLQKENLDHSATLLAVVNDCVPYNVFSCNSNEADLDSFKPNDSTMKQLLDSDLVMKQNHLNNVDTSDKISCALNESVQRFTTNSQLLNNLDGNLGVFEYTADDNFSFHSTISNDNAMYEKRIDDAEILEYLGSGDTYVNNYQFSLYSQLPSYELNVLENKSSSQDLDSQFNTSNTSTLELSSSLFTEDEVDNTANNNLQAVYNLESKFAYMSDDEKFLCESEAEPKELEPRLGNRNFDLYSSGYLSSRYFNRMESCSRCTPPFIVRRDLNKLKISELEDMLARKKIFDNYSNTYFAPSVVQNVISDSRTANNNNMQYCEMGKNSDDKLHSQVERYSEVTRFAPTILSSENWRSKEFGYQNIEQTLHSHLPEGTNISIPESAAISNYNTLKIARKNHWLKLNSPCDEALLNSQLYSYGISSREPEVLDNLPTVVKKLDRVPVGNRKKQNENKDLNVTFIHCGYCKKKYTTNKDLAKHVKDVHNAQTSQYTYKRKKFVCDKCSKEYCFPGAIKKHLKLHENYSLTCRKCGKHFSERRFLTIHTYHYHGNRLFQCSYCSQKFARRNDLTRHLRQCYDIDDRWLKYNI